MRRASCDAGTIFSTDVPSMSYGRARRRRGTIVTAWLAVALAGCASGGRQPAGSGDLHRIKRVIDSAAPGDSAAVSTEFVQVLRRSVDSLAATRVPLAAVQDMALIEGDSLSLASTWRTRLRLTTAADEWDWVVLAPELTTARGDPAPGRGPDGTPGEYSIVRRDGRAVVDLHRGAVVLMDWGANTGEAVCVRAAGLCAVGADGASFAVRVDAEGVGNLFVSAGDVMLTSESRYLRCWAADTRPDVACGIAPPSSAGAGTAWAWRDDIPAQETVSSDDRERWEGAIRYTGEELWRERRARSWAPWLLVPAAVVACLATDFWICGDDSISGTVIVVGP